MGCPYPGTNDKVSSIPQVLLSPNFQKELNYVYDDEYSFNNAQDGVSAAWFIIVADHLNYRIDEGHTYKDCAKQVPAMNDVKALGLQQRVQPHIQLSSFPGLLPLYGRSLITLDAQSSSVNCSDADAFQGNKMQL